MTPEVAIELINAAHHTTYVLGQQYSGGEDQGAYRIEDTAGQRAVLKVSRNPRWADQVRRGKAATDRLRTLGYPVPTYTFIESVDNGSYWIESELPGGGVIGNPTSQQITDLIRLIDLQKDQAISEVQGQDWVWYIADVVFRGESGNVRALMQFSPATSAIVYAAEALVAGLQGKMLPKTDLVHGAMSISQVLFSEQSVSGVLDWDQAGYGDRTIDLTGLWYSILDATQERDLVMQHMLEVSDKDAIKIYAVNKILAQVAWHINKVHGEVDQQVIQAGKAIELLKLL
jgi:aminoglycoside phosphotransferase (APT) family kinase protein